MTSLKVLIIDDDAGFLQVLKTNLESKKCDVKTATRQSEAIPIIVNEVIDIVFIDCILLSDEGLSVARKIRQIVGNSVEIVLMSNIVSYEDISVHKDLKLLKFLKKPLLEEGIQEVLSLVKEKRIYGDSDNFLTKIFNEKISEIHKLKFLFNINQVEDFELLLTISFLLNSNENVSLKFSFEKESKKHEHIIFIEKGHIVNHAFSEWSKFLQFLLQENFLTEKEKSQKTFNEERFDQILIEEGIMSPHQLRDVKKDLIFNSLKESVGEKIKMTIKFEKSKDKNLSIDQDAFSDEIFSLLNQISFFKFKNLINDQFSLFPLNSKKQKSYLPQLKHLESTFLSGKSFAEIRSSSSFSDKEFYSQLCYILLKGDVFVKNDYSYLQYDYLHERYHYLIEFISKMQPLEAFRLIGGLESQGSCDMERVKKLYRQFMQHNHTDKLPRNLPKEVVDKINVVLLKIKEYMIFLTDEKIQMAAIQKKKDLEIKSIIMNQKKRKLVYHYLEQGKYAEGFKSLFELPESMFKEDPLCKLLYLWIAFQRPSLPGIEEEKKKRYIQEITFFEQELNRSPLYLYVLGLQFIEKKNDKKAIEFFQKSKTCDLSFLPAQEALKAALLREMKNKSKNSKLFDFISVFNKKKKPLKKTS